MKKFLFSIAFLFVALFAIVIPVRVDAFNLNLFNSAQSSKIVKVAVKGSIDNVNHQVKIEFTKLSDAKHIWYELSYNFNGTTEGAKADFDVNGQSKIVKTIFLGTCSTGGNCVIHTPSSAHLSVVVQYRDGTNFASNYTIR